MSGAPRQELDERTLAGVRVRIDRLLCVGFGDCLDAAPGVFALDDEGVAVFADGADGATRAALEAACEACPVDALSLVEGREAEP